MIFTFHRFLRMKITNMRKKKFQTHVFTGFRGSGKLKGHRGRHQRGYQSHRFRGGTMPRRIHGQAFIAGLDDFDWDEDADDDMWAHDHDEAVASEAYDDMREEDVDDEVDDDERDHDDPREQLSVVAPANISGRWPRSK